MKQKLIDMLVLQQEMNQRVHPEWRAQNFEWYRAIWIESAELLDHYGWKWWKKQTPDLPQVQLELVDIWHFALSNWLQGEQNVEAIAERLSLELTETKSSAQPFPLVLEAFVSEVVGKRLVNVALFGELMSCAEMSFDKLYEMYVGKNVLNRFRQDHGYQDGTYQKSWGGREDNEHLAELLEQIKKQPPELGEVTLLNWLYEQLQQKYRQFA